VSIGRFAVPTIAAKAQNARQIRNAVLAATKTQLEIRRNCPASARFLRIRRKLDIAFAVDRNDT
jgi:hypothetical protein